MNMIKNFYAFILYVSDSGIQCNKHNSYWYGVQYPDRQTALESWYGPWFPWWRVVANKKGNEPIFRSVSVEVITLNVVWSPPWLYKPLRPCYTVKQVSRYLYHATLCIIILVSLHTKSSIMFHAEFFNKWFPLKWRNLTMKTLSYKLRRLSICSFDQITSPLFPPFQSWFIYHVLTMCFYLLMMLKPPDLKPRSLIGQT
jgi:hypothetical protein